jgi:hypothetical protein
MPQNEQAKTIVYLLEWFGSYKQKLLREEKNDSTAGQRDNVP